MRRGPVRAAAALLLAATLTGGALLAGCAPGAPGGAAAPPGALYVVDAGAAAVVRVDPQTGRSVGGPLPAGRAPWQAVPGPHEGLLVLSVPAGAQALTRVVRAGPGWAARPLPVEGGVREAVLAGAGAATRCSPTARHRPGRRLPRPVPPGAARPGGGRGGADARGVRRRGVAEGRGPGRGPRRPGRLRRPLARGGGPAPAGRGRRGGPGAGGGARRRDRGGAGGLRHAPGARPPAAGPGAGRRGPARLLPGDRASRHAESWRLVALDGETLVPERAYPFPAAPLWPALAPDGEHLYAFTGDGGGFASDVVVLDLTTGAVSPLLTLPGEGMGLAATAETLYAVDPDRGRLWSIDRRSGRLRGATAVGRTPIALTLRPAG